MDALERSGGAMVAFGNKMTIEQTMNVQGEGRDQSGHKSDDGWFEDVRRDLGTILNEGTNRFDAVRSEAAFRRVIAKLDEDRRLGFWGLRFRSLARALGALTTTAAGLWGSRTVRFLMP